VAAAESSREDFLEGSNGGFREVAVDELNIYGNMALDKDRDLNGDEILEIHGWAEKQEVRNYLVGTVQGCPNIYIHKC
jgi:hypothetical protein